MLTVSGMCPSRSLLSHMVEIDKIIRHNFIEMSDDVGIISPNELPRSKLRGYRPKKALYLFAHPKPRPFRLGGALIFGYRHGMPCLYAVPTPLIKQNYNSKAVASFGEFDPLRLKRYLSDFEFSRDFMRVKAFLSSMVTQQCLTLI